MGISVLCHALFYFKTDWKKGDGSSLYRDEFMGMLVQVDLLHVLADENAELSLQLPVMKPLNISQVEKCFCPRNTTGLSCQVSSVHHNDRMCSTEINIHQEKIYMHYFDLTRKKFHFNCKY